jgi:hypothetical protein
MCTGLLPPGVNPIAVKKYIKNKYKLTWNKATSSPAARQDVPQYSVNSSLRFILKNMNKLF